jgi:hypothetical protein
MPVRISNYKRPLTFLTFVALGIASSYGYGTQANADQATRNTPVSPQAASETVLPFFESALYGDYSIHYAGRSCLLTLRSDHHFSFQWSDFTNKAYYTNSGTWQLQGDVITLQPEKPNWRTIYSGLNIRYVPVRWDTKNDFVWLAQYFLVDENEMPGFCVKALDRSAMQRSLSAPFGEDFVKVPKALFVDFIIPLDGAPVIPERYKTYYDDGDIQGHVVRITEDGNVILDKGTADRVKPKMLFAFFGGEAIDLQVVSATEHQSVAQPVYFWSSARSVKVGDSFTTGTTGTRPHGTGYQHFNKPPLAPKPVNIP